MSDAPAKQPWYRQFWPWFLIALPLVVVIACLYTVFLALDSPLSIVKDDYYKEGLAINQNNAPYRQARALGLQADIRWLPTAQLQVELRRTSASTTAWTAPETLILTLAHPLDHSKDVEWQLRRQGDVYVSDAMEEALRLRIQGEPRWYISLHAAEVALRGESALGLDQPAMLDSGRE